MKLMKRYTFQRIYDSSIQNDDDEYLEDELPKKQLIQKKGPRKSVSAEAFGIWNRKSDFKPRVVEKSEDTKQKIHNRLKQSFLFSSLTEKEMSIVVDAMEERRHGPNETLIK